MMPYRSEGIYTTHGQKKLLCVAARVNGHKALAFQKEGQPASYIIWDEVEEHMKKGPYIEIIEANSQ